MSSAGYRIFPSLEAMQKHSASKIADALRPSVDGQVLTLALSGGSTPRGMHEELAGHQEIDWSNVHIFWGDERTVPPDHKDSNYRMAKESLLDHINIPEENVHRMRGEIEPEAAARQYEETLRRVFNTPAPEVPRFDVIVLGMGADGHTASLFPGTTALEETERLAVANHVPQLGTDRITLTYPVLNAARSVIFLVAGDDKPEAVWQSLNNEEVPPPAGLVQPVDGDLLWCLDSGAAAVIIEKDEQPARVRKRTS